MHPVSRFPRLVLRLIKGAKPSYRSSRETSPGSGRRIAATMSLIAIAGFGVVGCSRTVTHESGVPPFEYDATGSAGDATFTASNDPAYAGQYAAKVHYDGNHGNTVNPPNSFARGTLNANVPADYEGYYGAALYFLPGTFTGPSPKQRARFDVIRWDNAADNPTQFDYTGIRINADHKARLVRGTFNPNTPPREQQIGSSFALQEGCWNWLVVHQKGSQTAGRGVNEVFLNGVSLFKPPVNAPNTYGRRGNSLRFGLMNLDETAQDEAFDFYVDNAYMDDAANGPVPPTANACDPRPNVVFIVTDDQRLDGTMEVMPKTKKWFHTGDPATNTQGGTFFREAVATTPLCCPSRTSIFTGRYAHNHGVIDNNDRKDPVTNLGAVDEFTSDQDALNATLQSYLKNAGYQTAIYGKYLNSKNDEKPAIWDKYGLVGGAYCPFHTFEGTSETTGQLNRYPPQGTQDECNPDRLGVGDLSSDSPYSTHFVRDRALQFISDASQSPKPFFLYLAPVAPHPPYVPEAKYANASLPFFDFNRIREPYLTDKPLWVQNWHDTEPVLDHNDVPGARAKQLRTLMSVDDMVEAVFDRLQAVGRANNTIAFFMSDNGYNWREHGKWQNETFEGCPPTSTTMCGLVGKNKPYTDSIRIPFYLRWPDHVATNAEDTRMVGNIDMARTVINAHNTSNADSASDISLLRPMDGFSLLTTQPRNVILTEGWPLGGPKTWASIRSPTYHYIEYYGDSLDPAAQPTFREFYDLTTDSLERHNQYGGDGNPDNDPATNPTAAELRQRLTDYRKCVGQVNVPNPCP
jgi:arylsulfatase A-like enzyme